MHTYYTPNNIYYILINISLIISYPEIGTDTHILLFSMLKVK